MITSQSRGHEIIYADNQWLYNDTKQICDDSRPCKKCEEMPTEKGYDHCTGKIEGAKHACCGHGSSEPYVIWE